MPTSPQALVEAWQCYRSGDHPRAHSRVLAFLQSNPGHADALRLLGSLHLAAGQLAEGVDYLRQATMKQPEDIDSQNQLALALARLGRLEEAEACFRAVLRVMPDSLGAMCNLGLVLKNRGQWREAEDCFRQALRLHPNTAEAHNGLGLVLKEQQKLAEALAELQRAVQINPGVSEFHNNLGLVLKDQGKFSEALACYGRALQLRPDYIDALTNLGNVLRELKRLDESEALLRRMARLTPDAASAHVNLGLTLQEQGKLSEALACYGRALQLRPDYIVALTNLGNVLRELKRLEESEALLRRVAHLTPNDASAQVHLGMTLLERDKDNEALACLREAIRLEPTSHEAWSSLGSVLQKQGKLLEALDCYREGVRLKPDHPLMHLNLGLGLEELNRLPEAESCYERTLQLRPNDPEAHLSLAFLALRTGNFVRGWGEYEWRYRTRMTIRLARSFRQPRWDGSALGGRTLLVYSEQGLGDALQFVRYLELVKQHHPDCTVLFEALPSQLELLRRSPGADRIVAASEPLPDFDVQIALMSLPVIFGTTLETIPSRVPYVHPDPELVEHWRRELAPLDGFKVGIVWQGNPELANDRHRSAPLRHFTALAQVPGVRLLSLQKNRGTEQIAQLAGAFPLTDLDRHLRTFADTAAVVRNLDLVVSVDTAVAHLAGAVAAPVWLTLPFTPEWRWLSPREDSPWYPTMRLFRQQQRGDWPELFARLAEALRARIEKGP